VQAGQGARESVRAVACSRGEAPGSRRAAPRRRVRIHRRQPGAEAEPAVQEQGREREGLPPPGRQGAGGEVMKAGVFERLGLLVRADAHGVIESVEERSLLAKQLLREAELEVARKRARSESIERELAKLGADEARAQADLAALDADVDLALSRGEEDLAR